MFINQPKTKMADNFIDKQYERYLAKNQARAKKELEKKAKLLENYKKRLAEEAHSRQQKKESEKNK